MKIAAPMRLGVNNIQALIFAHLYFITRQKQILSPPGLDQLEDSAQPCGKGLFQEEIQAYLNTERTSNRNRSILGFYSIDGYLFIYFIYLSICHRIVCGQLPFIKIRQIGYDFY